MQGLPVSLAVWVADPVAVAAALEALPRIQQQLRSHRDVQAVFPLRLSEIILRFWSGQDTDAAYQNLSVLLDEPYHRAQLELCIGQLLMACRSLEAWLHLDQGFQLATHLLEPEDYFVVLKRHELLRQLPLRTGNSRAVSLDTLLNEAAVIVRLKGDGNHPYTRSGHRDTLG